MTSGMVAAAVQLADLLARENAALEAIDLPLAASMVPEKQRAASAFAVAAAAAGTLEGIHRAAAEDTARRLQALAALTSPGRRGLDVSSVSVSALKRCQLGAS